MAVLVVYYSLYGHVHKIAQADAVGVRNGGATPVLRRVSETLSPEVIETMGATVFRQEFARVHPPGPYHRRCGDRRDPDTVREHVRADAPGGRVGNAGAAEGR